MNPITNLMMNGYMGMQLLEFVMRQFPQSRKKIELALQQGYSPEQIGTYVEKEFAGKADTKAKRRLEKNISGTPTDAQASRVKELRSKREEKLAKTVGGIGLAAAALPIAGAAIRGGMLGRGAQTVAGRLGQMPPGPNNPPGSMPLPGAGPKGPMGGGPMPQGGAGGPVGAMGGIPTTQIMQAYAQHLAKGGRLSMDSFMKTAMGVMAGKGGQAKPGANPAAQQPEGPIDVTGEVQVTTPGQPTAPMPMQQPAPANAAPMQAQEQSIEQAATPEQQQAQKEQEADTILDAMKLKPTIEKMLKAGNQPNVIADLIGFKMTPGEKAWVKEKGIDVPTLVKDYADKVTAELGQQPSVSQSAQNEPQQDLATQPESQAALDQLGEANDMIENEPEEPKPLTAGASVMLPNGDLGTVTAVDGRKVSIDVDGQKKQAPIEHVLQPSQRMQGFTQDDADAAMDAYIETQDLSQKSAPLLYVDYVPGLKMMGVRWTSAPEISGYYTNVSPETAAIVNARITENKTSGRSGEGVIWTAGAVGKVGAAVNKEVKQILDESGAVFHPYHKGDVIFNRHEAVEEKIAQRNTGKNRQEREETRARTAEKQAAKVSEPKKKETNTQVESPTQKSKEVQTDESHIKTPAESELPEQYADWASQKKSKTYENFSDEDLNSARKNFSTRHDYYLREGFPEKRVEMREKLDEIDREKKRRKDWKTLQRKALQKREADKSGKLYITKNEKKNLIENQRDVYKEQKVQKVSKGINERGEEVLGYPYAPEYFIKSDLSGKPVRHYVILPDNRIAHPDELEDFVYRDRIVVESNEDRFKIPKAPWEEK